MFCLYHFIKILFVQKSSYKVQSRKPNVEFYFRNFFFIYYYYFIFFGTRYKSVIIGEGDNNMYAIFVCICWHYNTTTRSHNTTKEYHSNIWRTFYQMYHGLIDSLVFNANFSSISAMSWHHGSSGKICSFNTWCSVFISINTILL